ncbi:MAG TPA: hypothetical protein VM008_08045 [Phycisphaerae bacterium]|nr:hypothetical protein [Phycisphaerae bacterium]
MPPRRKSHELDPARILTRLPSTYPHIGLYDVKNKKPYAARQNLPRSAIDLQHAELFTDHPLTADTARPHEGIALKDRYLCFWFYTPHTREGPLQGYPIDWSEHNLLVRLDPRWSYARQILLPAHQTAAIDANINAQLAAATHLMSLYRAHGLDQPLSLHMIGPRATDSLFYARRWEPKY